MIERQFIIQKTKEFYIKKYVEEKLRGVGISQIRLKKIPLGEKLIIHTSRPSLLVGSKGSNIRELTKALKTKFGLENPQIEVVEVKDIFLDANIVAQRIASSLERFGSARFKGVGHKIMENVMNSGALGIELVISGKIPGARAKSWRFYQGYLKKCGDISVTGVRKAQASALLKSGTIGIKVAIMPPNLILPDHIEILDEPVQVDEEVKEEKSTKSGKTKAKTTKKKTEKSAEKAEKVESKTEVAEEAKANTKTDVAEPVAEQPKVEETKVAEVAEKIEDQQEQQEQKQASNGEEKTQQ